MTEPGDAVGTDPLPCPTCGTPVPPRPSGRPGLARGSCGTCGLQLVRGDAEPAWREIRG